MNDPIPVGSITLKAAFDRYLETCGGAAADIDDRLSVFRDAFTERHLEARVQQPGKAEAWLPPESWRIQFNAERVFLSADIDKAVKGPWAAHRERTPYVNEVAFTKWLRQNGPKPDPDPADFDVMGEPIWSMPMLVAWVASGSETTVRWQWDKFRKAAGLGRASLALNINYGEEHPMFFSGERVALDSITRELRAPAPKLVATGIRADTGERVIMPSMLWIIDDGNRYARTFAADFIEQWNLGGNTYIHVAFDREQILNLWPAQDKASSYPSEPKRSVVTIDPTAPWTSFDIAALWVGNGGADCEVEDGAIERGASEILKQLHSGKLRAQGRANDIGAERHGYREDIPTWRWEGAAFEFDATQPLGKPRLILDHIRSDTAMEDDPGRLAADFFLPDQMAARWLAVEVDTHGLLTGFSDDDWVPEYKHPGGPGAPSSEPLVRQALARRIAQRKVLDSRSDEAEYLSRWLNGTPREKGWPATSQRVVDRHITTDFAKLSADRTK